MNRAFNKLESKLSMLGEVKVTYMDILKVQQTTPANQCLAQFQEQKKETCTLSQTMRGRLSNDQEKQIDTTFKPTSYTATRQIA